MGLDIGHQHIRVAVCDLSGKPVLDDWSPAEVDHAPVESLDLAHELVRDALASAGVDRDRLLGVGMGLAAPINKLTGELEANGILPGWHGIRPAEEMERRLGFPVQLENDANVGALGEKVFGAARGVDDLIYVRLSAGVGAGLILDGRPYHGVRGVAGEIGHVLADPNGLICRCGNRGCLETVASPVAVAALLERSTGQRVSVQRLIELVALRRPRRPAGRGRCGRARGPGAGVARQRAQPRAGRRRRRARRGRDGAARPDPRSDRAPRRHARVGRRDGDRAGRSETAPRCSARPR